jgi:hypothetical protein
MTLTGFTLRHPYRSALLFLLIVIVVIIATGMINTIFLKGSLVQLATGDLVLAFIGIFLLTRLDWWKTAGYTTGIRLAQIPLVVLPVLAAMVPLIQGIRVTAPLAILAFAALTLVVGFAEETFFRGLILNALLPTGTIRAVALSSVLFAAPHFLNIIGGAWDPYFTIADSIAAFGLGMTFVALRLRTGSIWPLIGVHGLFDFCSLVTLGGVNVPAQSPQVLLMSVLYGIVFVFYGLFLLRGERERGSGITNAA